MTLRDYDAAIAACRRDLEGLHHEEEKAERRVRRAREIADAAEARARAGAQEALDL